MKPRNLIILLLFVIMSICGMLFLWGGPQQTNPMPKLKEHVEEDLKPATLAPQETSAEAQKPLLRKPTKKPHNAPDVAETDFQLFIADEPDPVGVGACTLELRIFDIKTQQPVSGKVQIWRINAPSTKHWNAGDQLQLEAEAKDGVLLIPNLPVGEYRAFILFARKGTDSSPPFQIDQAFTLVERFITLPQPSAVYLRLFRIDGTPIKNYGNGDVEIKSQGDINISDLTPNPQWKNQRASKNGGYPLTMSRGFDLYQGAVRKWITPPANPYGILLGRLEGETRQHGVEYRRLFRRHQGQEVMMKLHSIGVSTYAALYIDAQELQSRLVFPPGAEWEDFSKMFTVEAYPVPIYSELDDVETKMSFSAQTWRHASLHIKLQAEGYAAVDIRWSPQDGPLQEIKLWPSWGH